MRRDDAAALLEKHQRLLVASAVGGGLTRTRQRSSPDRVAIEARRFVQLLVLAVRAASARELARAISEEVRVGALAGASVAEIDAACGIWRRALEGLVAAANLEPARTHLIRALSSVASQLREEAERFIPQRVNLIVVGASAGGIGALTEILSDLDATLPLTFLVVIHVSPRLPSLLPVVLARRSKLSIATAVEGASLYFGYVYVAPPGRHLVLSDGLLHLVDGPPVHFVKPSADVLFESAAGIHGSAMVSLVLSGTGADGATGTRIVHEHGGITVVQDPKSAEFNGMPEAAIATGTVDHIVPIHALAGMLERLAAHGRSALTAPGLAQHGV